MRRPALAIVAAIAENGVIGRDNGLAWRLRTDMRRFRELTLGKPLVMGRRTWDSIGKPLPGRETVVLTRDPAFAAPGVHVARDWPDAKRLAVSLAGRMGAGTVAIVGGADVYRLALPEADILHLTRVHARPKGDVTFPSFPPEDFREDRAVRHEAGPGDDHAVTFLDLVRAPPGAPRP